jgi:hypothetical protein
MHLTDVSIRSLKAPSKGQKILSVHCLRASGSGYHPRGPELMSSCTDGREN